MAVAGDRGPGSNGLAIASVLVGMVAVPLFFFPLPATAAIVLGVVGHRHARDLNGEVMGAIDYPAEGEWRRNDRTVRCFVIAKDGAPKLTQSARDIAHTQPA